MSGIWWGRRGVADGVELLGIANAEHPDGVIVDLGENAPPEPPLISVELAAAGAVRRVVVSPVLQGSAPPLWYVEAPETAANPPAMVLVAFGTDDHPDGTVVDQARFTAMPLRSESQVAAIRWWPANGQIHQVYVAPDHRRHGIGRKLVAAAGGYRVGRGWAPIWVSGERTDLGEAALGHSPDFFTGRITPRHTHSPPM